MAKVNYVKPKGSIVYKILIALLAVVLIGTIIYPKTLWDQEEKNVDACRENMVHILYAELVYLNENATYTDTLEKAVDLSLPTLRENDSNFLPISTPPWRSISWTS